MMHDCLTSSTTLYDMEFDNCGYSNIASMNSYQYNIVKSKSLSSRINQDTPYYSLQKYNHILIQQQKNKMLHHASYHLKNDSSLPCDCNNPIKKSIDPSKMLISSNKIPFKLGPVSLHTRIIKTKICVHNLSGRCSRGDDCSFAHSMNELRDPPNLFKTRLCINYASNRLCGKGLYCRFAHGEEELRKTEDTTSNTALGSFLAQLNPHDSIDYHYLTDDFSQSNSSHLTDDLWYPFTLNHSDTKHLNPLEQDKDDALHCIQSNSVSFIHPSVPFSHTNKHVYRRLDNPSLEPKESSHTVTRPYSYDMSLNNLSEISSKLNNIIMESKESYDTTSFTNSNTINNLTDMNELCPVSQQYPNLFKPLWDHHLKSSVIIENPLMCPSCILSSMSLEHIEKTMLQTPEMSRNVGSLPQQSPYSWDNYYGTQLKSSSCQQTMKEHDNIEEEKKISQFILSILND